MVFPICLLLIVTDVNFLTVAVHEIGHALGLGHSTVSDATMYAFYSADNKKEIGLGADDKEAIRALYPD